MEQGGRTAKWGMKGRELDSSGDKEVDALTERDAEEKIGHWRKEKGEVKDLLDSG